MAPSSSPLILGITTIWISIFMISPSHSATLTCATQKLPSTRTYANCTELPTLGATLHFTFNATNNSLSVAFAAHPPTPDGWVAWGINPSGGGMVGTQALIAYKLNGTVGVHTYNLTSYKGIDPVKSLSFETWDLAADQSSDGAVTVFAAVKLPEKADNISQVWQVGPVASGKPSIHEFKAENLNAKEALTTTAATATGEKSSGGALIMGERFGLGFYFGLVLLLMSFITM